MKGERGYPGQLGPPVITRLISGTHSFLEYIAITLNRDTRECKVKREKREFEDLQDQEDRLVYQGQMVMMAERYRIQYVVPLLLFFFTILTKYQGTKGQPGRPGGVGDDGFKGERGQKGAEGQTGERGIDVRHFVSFGAFIPTFL